MMRSIIALHVRVTRKHDSQDDDKASALRHSRRLQICSQLRAMDKIPPVQVPLHRLVSLGCQWTSARALQLPGQTPPESLRRDLHGIELSMPDFRMAGLVPVLCRYECLLFACGMHKSTVHFSRDTTAPDLWAAGTLARSPSSTCRAL